MNKDQEVIQKTRIRHRAAWNGYITRLLSSLFAAIPYPRNPEELIV